MPHVLDLHLLHSSKLSKNYHPVTWLVLKEELVSKHLPLPPETTKGHLKQEFKIFVLPSRMNQIPHTRIPTQNLNHPPVPHTISLLQYSKRKKVSLIMILQAATQSSHHKEINIFLSAMTMIEILF